MLHAGEGGCIERVGGMADRKLFAGHAVRRLRRQAGLTQAAMSEVLAISASYLNLVERNQRPLSASLLVKLAESFDFDPRALAAGEPGGGESAIRRRLADPMFADLEIDRNEIEEWLAGAPGGAEAFARAYDPQWFHSDADMAKQSVFGELVASGIHVLAMWRQLDHEINSDIDFVCGVGWDELRLKRAIRAGDIIHVTSEIIDLRPSTTRADRGTALTRYAVLVESGEKAVTFTSINLVYTREGVAQRQAG